MHLNPAELVDLAEGSRPESSAPHLGECPRCRQQMLEMRAMMAAAADASPVPEPSPLFWDQLSRRVRQAIDDEERVPRRRWPALSSWRRLLVPVSAAAAAILLIVAALTWRASTPQPPLAAGVTTQAPGAAALDPFEDSAADDDSLMLVADLSAVAGDDDAQLEPDVRSDHAVTHLDGDELRELQRLLQEELTPSGTSL